jgi:hypothetical protein
MAGKEIDLQESLLAVLRQFSTHAIKSSGYRKLLNQDQGKYLASPTAVPHRSYGMDNVFTFQFVPPEGNYFSFSQRPVFGNINIAFNLNHISSGGSECSFTHTTPFLTNSSCQTR